MIYNKIVKDVLSFEHLKVAGKLGFIELSEDEISYKLLVDAIGVIDYLSRRTDEKSNKIVVILCAILWEYRQETWDGLSSFLIIILTRIGFAPSSVMVDSGFDPEESQYSGMNSKIDEMLVSVSQLQYEVFIQSKLFLLTKFQKNIWSKIDEHKVLGISAPTSAGKSFIIALKSIEVLIKNPGVIIYIVPTLSLVSQVSADFRKLLNEFELTEYEILNTYTGEYEDNKKIFVLTQEKAIGAFSKSDNPFNDVRILVVDEIQNVERVSNADDQRSKTLYDLLVEFRYTSEPEHIIISGPRIEEIGSLGHTIFGQDTDEEISKSSPVASITYAISKSGKNYYIKQYTDITEEPLSIHITKNENINGHGGSMYSESFHDYMSGIIHSLGIASKNIIFSPTSNQARKTALAIAGKKELVDLNNLDSLVQYLQHTVHHEYPLCISLKKGVAYHHGKLPLHVRRVVEKAIRDKIISNVVCTTTLMQGVNLPAQNIIIRNPSLALKKKNGIKPQLTHYEIANLRGRAGRLLKDFLGRTFILDEDSFEVDNERQESLFEDTTKEIKTGYEGIYDEYKYHVDEGLLSFETPTEDNKEYSFLLTYIRQTILRHDEKSLTRLNNIGIHLEEEKFIEIRTQLSQLEIPQNICLQNRYWDPIALESLYKIRNKFDLPINAFDKQIPYKLREVLSLLEESCPVYYKRYFGIYDSNDYQLVLSACFNANKWIKEIPLYDILSDKYYDNPENIDKTISYLQGRISYGLPMLLRPIYDIKEPDSSFLSFLDSGAYRPVTKRLIEYSVPRETAISLTNNYLSNLDVNSKDFDYQLRHILKDKFSELNYWVQAQLDVLI